MQKGFTLIEMLVSVAIFSIVMVIALGALLAMSESDRKAQTLKGVIDNLNFSLDSMSRSIRTGTGYYCGNAGGPDCVNPGGKSYFSYTDSDGRSVAYCLSAPRASNPNVFLCTSAATVSCAATDHCSILRSTDGGNTFAPLTADEVHITNLSFYLLGSSPADQLQPKLTLLLSGEVSVTATQTSAFNLETTVTQRLYDQ